MSATVGHNSGEPIALISADDLREDWRYKETRKAELVEQVDAWIADHPHGIESDDADGIVSAIIKQLREEARQVDEIRKRVKQPFLDATKVIDGFFKAIIDPMHSAGERLTRLSTEYGLKKLAEAKRRAREAEVAAREEAMRLAAANDLDRALAQEEIAENIAATPIDSADASRVHGDYGTTASLRSSWTYEVVDKMALIRAVADGSISADALVVSDDWIKSKIKQRNGRDGIIAEIIPGVVFRQEYKRITR